MVSNAEIRKREATARQQRRARAAECVAIVVALSLSVLPRTPLVVCLVCSVMALLLIYAFLQLPWIREASPASAKVTKTILTLVGTLGVVGAYGVFVWPPHHRHALSEKEKAEFEEPLKSRLETTVSVQMACPTNDEVDCVYASNLIPLFGEAGWNVRLEVTRVSLQRPMQGINLVLHSTTDYVPKKWNEGVWTKMLPAIVPIDKAFVAIGIEPDSNSGFSVGDNQIIVYVGPERDDEAAPTQLTHTVESMEQVDKDRREGKITPPTPK